MPLSVAGATCSTPLLGPVSPRLRRVGCLTPGPGSVRVHGGGSGGERLRVPEMETRCPRGWLGRAGAGLTGSVLVAGSGCRGHSRPGTPPGTPPGPRPEARLCLQAWRSLSTSSPTAGSWTSCVGAPGACSRTSRTPPPRSSSPWPGGSGRGQPPQQLAVSLPRVAFPPSGRARPAALAHTSGRQAAEPGASALPDGVRRCGRV